MISFQGLARTLAAFVVVALSSTASAQSVPEGWRSVDVPPGRVAAVVHPTSHARMEAWRVTIEDGQFDSLRGTFEARLKGEGFVAAGTRDLKLGALAATLRLYTRGVLDREFTLLVVEVARSGELWQFTAIYRPAETLNREKQEADLQAWATAQLAANPVSLQPQ